MSKQPRSHASSSKTLAEPIDVDNLSPVQYDLTLESDEEILVLRNTGPLSSIHQDIPNRKLNRKRGSEALQQTIIEILDDSDVEEIKPTQRPLKKIKREQEVLLESDEDYEALHAGFDFENADHWHPVKENDVKVEAEVTDVLNNLTLSTALPPKNYRNISNHRPVNMASSTAHPTFIWDILQVAKNMKFKKRDYPTRLYGKQLRHSSLKEDLGLNTLEAVTSFKQAPGSTNRIEQKNGYAAIASACIEGLPDQAGGRLHYNRKGSLLVYNQNAQVLNGHYRVDDHSGIIDKYYAVHDVKFDPQTPSFISSGADGTVRVWDRINTGYSEKCILPNNNGDIPHDLAFKPGSSVLAVAKRKLHVYSGIRKDASSVFFTVSENDSHTVGAIAWGVESATNLLFASSEPEDDNEFVGSHKAFDLNLNKLAYAFDACEAGDAIGLSPTGGQLVITTRGADSTRIMRLYDTARWSGLTVHKYDLEPFPADCEGEINTATFSSDGIYLALARNDNTTHVYDSRMLGKGLLYDFKHTGPCRTLPDDTSFGVVRAQWVETASSRLGLVTGGDDGCVRLWDPLKSSNDPENGMIIAEVGADIGDFSLGDRTQREHTLIVGDSTGEVSIFDKNGGIFNGI